MVVNKNGCKRRGVGSEDKGRKRGIKGCKERGDRRKEEEEEDEEEEEEEEEEKEKKIG